MFNSGLGGRFSIFVLLICVFNFCSFDLCFQFSFGVAIFFKNVIQSMLWSGHFDFHMRHITLHKAVALRILVDKVPCSDS